MRCAHDETAVTAAIRDLLAEGLAPILVLGASAIVDRRDVIRGDRAGRGRDRPPRDARRSRQRRTARPRRRTAILGVPGCARSLRRGGFDMVLERLAAGIFPSRADLMTLGTGGLLTDIPARMHPREGEIAPMIPEPAVAAVVLAAGRSRRMGPENKLLVEVDGAPMIARVVDVILATRARPVVIVTGHDADRVREALAGRDVVFAHNPRHDEGMSTSLKAGIAQLGEDLDGALICLGDMPRVRPAQIEALLGAFDPADGRAICVPVWDRRRGNPVLFAARYFPEMRLVEGDVGARSILERHTAEICYVPMDDRGVTLDIDTPEALVALHKEP
ncbi:MAG: NTP transferase domain-containing protein [Byssovorax sp.]